MNKLILAVLLFVAVTAYSATVSKSISGNQSQSVPIFSTNTADLIQLDSSEVDTSGYIFNLSSQPAVTNPDTIGYAYLQCKDSTGTDSTHVGLYWQFNADPKGQAKWVTGDSTRVIAASATTYQVGRKAIVNTYGQGAIRFYIKNQAQPAVAKKSTCQYVLINRKEKQ